MLGFTLAEVLITLVIIGVIAAITVPALITKYQKEQTVTRLKKAYSTLAQVTNKIIAEEGNPRADKGGWAKDRLTVFDLYKKYLINARECRNTNNCFQQGGFKHLNSTTIDSSWSQTTTPKLILSDGVTLLFTNVTADCSGNNFYSNDYCFTIGLDVNGAKKPNTWGKDAFVFVIKENGLYPAGCDQNIPCPYGIGQECTCKILRENSMNY